MGKERAIARSTPFLNGVTGVEAGWFVGELWFPLAKPHVMAAQACVTDGVTSVGGLPIVGKLAGWLSLNQQTPINLAFTNSPKTFNLFYLHSVWCSMGFVPRPLPREPTARVTPSVHSESALLAVMTKPLTSCQGAYLYGGTEWFPHLPRPHSLSCQ